MVLLGLVAASAGCSFQEPASWADQLSPDGPCWRVDLLDGLDTRSTEELHDLYACLSRQGAFQPLAPVVDALDGDSRAGVPLGVELAILVNGLSTVGLDVWALAGVGLDLLRAPDHPLDTALELGVELVYGRPYEVVVDEVDLGAGDELDRGVIAPLLPVVADGARVALDSDDAIPALLAASAEDPALADLACSVAGLATSTDPEVADLAERIVADLGDGLQRVTDASNDHHPGASGNSLRDLAVAGLVQRGDDGQTLLDATSPEILAIVQDSQVVDNLAETLADARDAGQLALLPAQLRYLATVDVAGDGLDPDEDSALTALLRLLDEANTEVDCSVDLSVIQFDFSLGNLSVALLSLLADQEPTTAASGVDLLGDLLGLGLTESTLELVADSGLCPVIDRQLVGDLQSIDRLSDPQVYDLLVNLLRVLDDLRSGEEDRLPATVDLVSELVQRGVVPPLEELVRDVGGAAIAADLVEGFGLVLEPAALQVEACPDDSHPVDLSGALGLVRATLDDRSGGAPIRVVQPLLDQVLVADGTWVAVDHFGALARFDDSRVHSLLSLVVRWLEVDPDLELATDLAALLSDPALSGPALRIAEDPGLIDAIAATPPTSDGPLPWAARAVVDGTVQA
ncbi:MAG: hypothetical protein D6798_16465, partial [Deltaproteobacteria bacterium]